MVENKDSWHQAQNPYSSAGERTILHKSGSKFRWVRRFPVTAFALTIAAIGATDFAIFEYRSTVALRDGSVGLIEPTPLLRLALPGGLAYYVIASTSNSRVAGLCAFALGQFISYWAIGLILDAVIRPFLKLIRLALSEAD